MLILNLLHFIRGWCTLLICLRDFSHQHFADRSLQIASQILIISDGGWWTWTANGLRFSSYFYFWLLKICVPPKCCGRQKGRLHLCRSGGRGGGGTDVLFCCWVKRCVSHPQSFARHPTEWGPAPLFWVIPKLRPWLWSLRQGRFPKAGEHRAALYQISSPVKWMLLSSHSVLGIKSSAILGLCLV